MLFRSQPTEPNSGSDLLCPSHSASPARWPPLPHPCRQPPSPSLPWRRNPSHGDLATAGRTSPAMAMASSSSLPCHGRRSSPSSPLLSSPLLFTSLPREGRGGEGRGGKGSQGPRSSGAAPRSARSGTGDRIRDPPRGRPWSATAAMDGNARNPS